MNWIGWTIFITFHLLMFLFQYGVGRICGRIHDGDWYRHEDIFFYWFIGLIVSTVIIWATIGLITLTQYITI